MHTGYPFDVLLIMGIKDVVRLMAAPAYTCERCGQHARHDVTISRRKLSLFFVPLLTLGKATYLDECTACGRVLSISRGDAEAATRPAPSGPQDAVSWTPQDR